MLVVGLTGGIGAGKSTVAAMLGARGAVVIDADRIAREVVEPGTPAYAAIIERFGASVVGVDGGLDRPALAGIVFQDPDARKALEAITHPAIYGEVGARTIAQASTDNLVVLDLPLLKEKREPMAAVIVVDVTADVAVERLVGQRGFDETDARRRIAAQISREERLAIADVVIDNSGDLAHLEQEIDRAWAWLETLRMRAPDPGAPHH